MKYLSIGLAVLGLTAMGWAGVILVNSRVAGSSGTSVRQDPSPSEPPLGGPIARGLQLRLSIVNPPNGTGSHSFRLALVNVSDAVVDLAYRQSSYDTRDFMPYEDEMRSGVGFSSFPEIGPDTFQDSVRYDETFVDRVHRLLPSQSVDVRWESNDERIAVANASWESSRGRYPRLTPHSTGQFLVRAMFDVETGEGSTLTLWSNECAFVVGGSLAPPKPHVVKISPRYQDGTSFSLSGGAADGIEAGDVFQCRVDLENSWVFTVSSVNDHDAVATVTPPRPRPGEITADFPYWLRTAELAVPVNSASRSVRALVRSPR